MGFLNFKTTKLAKYFRYSGTFLMHRKGAREFRNLAKSKLDADVYSELGIDSWGIRPAPC